LKFNYRGALPGFGCLDGRAVRLAARQL
jgi:hypothetical protein